MKTYVFSCLLLFCSSTICTFGQEVVSAEITDFGMYDGKSPDTQLKQTDTIPLEIGVCFGFHFQIICNPDTKGIPITLGFRITDLKGNTSMISYDMKYLPNAMATGRHTYIFESPEELIAGEWILYVAYNGKDVLTKKLFVAE